MNTTKTKLKLPIVALASLALVGIASAQKTLHADVTQSLRPANGDNYIEFNATEGPITFDRELGNEYGQSRATIYNSYGLVRNRSFAWVIDPNLGNISTQVNTTQTDRFTINAAGRDGQRGSFTASISFDGEYLASFGGHSNGGVIGEYDLNIAMTYPFVNGESTREDAASFFVNGTREVTDDYNATTFISTQSNGFQNGTGFGTYNFEVNFIYGVPIDFELELFTEAQAYFTDGYMDVDLSHTFEWLGASNFEDANGNSVTNVSTTSASGFNYVTGQPVPEPGTMLALGGGLAFLARRVRRNRRAQ